MQQLFQHPKQKQQSFFLQRKARLLCIIMMLFVCTHFTGNLSAQTTFTAVQSGPWNESDTWDAAAIPTASDDVYIAGGFTVTINSLDEACNSLTLGLGDGSGSGGIAFSGSSSLTTNDIIMGDAAGATGSITMDAGATLTCNTITESDPNFSGLYSTNLGTIVFNGSFTLPYNLFQFNNLVVNGGTLTTGGRNLPIEGDLTINDGATLDLGENTANRNTIAGTFTVNSGGTLRIGGGGTIPANFSTHVIGATSTIEYYGVAQTVATLNSGQNYGYLIISGTGLKEINGTIAIERDLTINSAIFSVNTFTANRTSAGGTLTVENGATLRIAGSGTLPSNFTTHAIGATSTIEYSGTSGQTVAALNSSQKYGNLNVYNAVKTLGGNITVAGTLAFAGTPNRLSIGNNTLTLEGAISGSLTGSRNFTGSANSRLVLKGAFNRTLFLDATTNGTTNALHSLTIDHSGNITTMGNDFMVNNTLTFTAGKLAIAARLLTIKGTIVNTVAAGLRGGTTSRVVFNGTSSPTLSMDQTTPGTTNVLSTLQINSSGQVVTLGNDLVMNSTLTFTTGKLSINGNTLTLKGLVTNTTSGGIRAGSTSNLVVNGTVSPSLSFDQTTPGTTNIINNVTINSASQTVTLLNALRLTGTHTPTNGVFASGGNYTIASTASKTANIAAGSAGGGYITGNVIVERFIPQNTNRAWRLLASPTNGQTIHEAWQESQAAGVNGLDGYGTNITSKASSWAADGFDFKTPSNSLLAYDQDLDSLIGISSTSQLVSDEPGYFMYIRGGRSITPSSSIVAGSATTLRTTGTLYTGNQSGITVPAGKRGLIGNPFASAIDLRNVSATGGCTGTSYYVWDPKLTGAYDLGAYQTLTPSGGNYIVVPGGGSYGSSGSIQNTIQSGAAFFVEASGSEGTITLSEASKTSGSSMVFRPGSDAEEKNLISNLYAVNNGNRILADGNMVFFSSDYAHGIDATDSRKMVNFGENLGIKNGSTNLAIDRRPVPVSNDTIQFAISKLKRINYELEILADRLHEGNLIAFLEDRFMNTLTPINLDDTTHYAFSVTATAASSAADRFRIVLRPATVLPVKFITVSATAQRNDVSVEWKVNSQVNMRSYQVAKSIDGRNFTVAATVPAQSDREAYEWLDATTFDRTVYYRINAIDNNGRVSMSQVVKVNERNAQPFVNVSPNPIENSLVNLQLQHPQQGKFTLRLTNMNGRVVFSSNFVHNGGTMVKTIQLPAQTTRGNYQLEVTAPDGTRLTKTILVN